MADPIGHVEGEATSAFPTTAPLPSGTYPGSGALSPSGPPMPVPSVLRASPGIQQRPPMYPYPGMWFGGIHTMPTGQNQPPLWYPYPPYPPMGYPPMGYPPMGMRPPQPEVAESQVGVSNERPPGEEEPHGNPPAFQPWQMPMPYYPGYPVPPHGFAPPGMPYTGHQQHQEPKSRKIKARNLNKYTGTTPWADWVRRFENNMVLEEIPETLWAARLWSELEGKAEAWFSGRTAPRRPVDLPWDEIKDIMSKGPFPQAETDHALLSSLRTLRMSKTEEGFNDYLNKFQETLAKVNPPPDDKSVCVDFVRGLDSTLQFQLHLRVPEGGTWTNFRECYEAAHKVWRSLVMAGHCKGQDKPAKEKGEGVSGTRQKGQDKKRQGEGKDREAKKPKGKGPRKPDPNPENPVPPNKDVNGKDIDKKAASDARAKGVCSFCHKPNHTWKNCRGYARKLQDTSLSRLVQWVNSNVQVPPSRCTSQGRRRKLTRPLSEWQVDPMEIDVPELSKYTLQYSSDSDSEVPDLSEKEDDVTSLWNKFLVPDQLDFLIQKSGMSPMLDASPNKEASTSPEYWSETKTFFQKDLAGLCVYMAPPAHNMTIKDYLSHYLAKPLPMWRSTLATASEPVIYAS